MWNPLITLFTAGLISLIGWLLWRPQTGYWWRWRRSNQINQRVLAEDALKYIHTCRLEGGYPSIAAVAGVLRIDLDEAVHLAAELEQDQLLEIEGETLHLTPAGEELALHVIRAHRLWERYLSEETGFSREEWHTLADRQEHALTEEEAAALAARLGFPTHDPHGDLIPPVKGEMLPLETVSLTDLPLNTPARIVHVEDEPEVIYAQLVASNIHPGMRLWVSERSGERVRFWLNGQEHNLAPVVARSVSVVPLPQEAADPKHRNGFHLSDLQRGESATVLSLSPACRGMERRRFMDLGILPGTPIKAEFISPSGDPTAYLVRGSLIALRRKQANLINVDLNLEAAANEKTLATPHRKRNEPNK